MPNDSLDELSAIADANMRRAYRLFAAEDMGIHLQCVDCPHSGDKWCRECRDDLDAQKEAKRRA
jgi:hypothetical protein